MRIEKLRDLYKMPWATDKQLSDRATEKAEEKIREYKEKLKK